MNDIIRDIQVRQNYGALTDDILSEIGQVTINHAILEWRIRALAHNLLECNNEQKWIITSEKPFRGLVDLCAALIKACDQTGLLHEEFKKIANSIDKSDDSRNKIMHSIYGLTENGLVRRSKAKAKRGRGLEWEREDLTKEDISKIAYNIAESSHVVVEFIQKHGLGDDYPS